MPWEVLFELVRIHVEILYHRVYVCYVGLQIVLLVLDPLVPDHRQQSFDVSLRHLSVLVHLKVCSSELSRQYVCLAFHDCSLLSQEISPGKVGSESGLYLENSSVLSGALEFSIICSDQVALHRRLDHH